MKTGVLGLRFDNVTMDEALARARELLKTEGSEKLPKTEYQKNGN